jgi:hypothetical protein
MQLPNADEKKPHFPSLAPAPSLLFFLVAIFENTGQLPGKWLSPTPKDASSEN